MSQHDLTVDNGSGQTVRLDLQAALQALSTLMAGATPPSPTWPNMRWLDTGQNPPQLKMRDAANTGWFVIATISGSVFIPWRDGAALTEAATFKVNLAATGDPGANDDASAGYALGSRWINTISGHEFVCASPAPGAAVWRATTVTGAHTHTGADLTDAGAFYGRSRGAGLSEAAGGIAIAATLDSTARIIVRKQGTVIGTRRAVNLGEGLGIALTLADDGANEEVDVTVAQADLGRGFQAMWEGKPGASSVRIVCGLPGRTLRIPASLTGALSGVARTAATAATDIAVKVTTDSGATWSSLGVLRLAAGGRSPSLQSGFGSDLDVLGGHALQFEAPATPDATLADLALCIRATIVA